MKLLVNAPINSLSFGNVTVNILKHLHKKNVDLCLFPIGENVDIQAYDKLDNSFRDYLQFSTNSRYEKIDADIPSFKLWHINGSESRLSKNQSLFTFHETSDITTVEKNLLNLQDNVFVSSNYSKGIFELNGIKNVHYVPLGFDSDFHKTNKVYLPDKIHFGLLGKIERRKNTSRIIKTWLKIFGNNPKYQLSCAISNRFLHPNDFQNELLNITEGKTYNNLNMVSYMQTNSEVNDFLNSIDIDLGGLSGGEGWNLPSFNATALGKWSVVLNATSHKDWATEKNSILINPSKLKNSHDGRFFVKGQAFNQGDFFDITDEEMESAILKSVEYAKKENPEGEKLKNEFTYEKTTETILNVIMRQSDS